MRKEEIIELMKEVKPGQFAVVCYDKATIYKEAEREQQINFYLEAMSFSDGSERNRYTNIFLGLKDGEQIIFDDEDDYFTYFKLTGQI